MVSYQVILHASSKLRFERTVLGRSHLAMVRANAFREGSGLPSLHSRCSHGDVIDTPAGQRHITADVLKAFLPKQLPSTPDVLYVREPVVVWERSLAKGRAHHSQFGILGNFAYKITEVARSKREVSVEIANHVIFPV